MIGILFGVIQCEIELNLELRFERFKLSNMYQGGSRKWVRLTFRWNVLVVRGKGSKFTPFSSEKSMVTLFFQVKKQLAHSSKLAVFHLKNQGAY